MWKSIRNFFESIVFAGMKPGGSPQPAKRMRWLGPLAGPLDSFLSGPATSDPLYLSNRSIWQRARLAVVIAVPCLLVVGTVVFALTRPKAAPPPPPEPTAAEMLARILPKVDESIKTNSSTDVQVLEAQVDKTGSPRVIGMVKNNTDRLIRSAVLALDLTDADGSQVGAVTGKLENIEPGATVKFDYPITQRAAVFAIVREVRKE